MAKPAARKSTPKPAKKAAKAPAAPALKVAYAKLATEWSLPPFEKVLHCASLEHLDPAKITLQDVAEKVQDRFYDYAKIIENILQSDTSLIAMTEANNLAAEDRIDAAKVLRILMVLDRELMIADLSKDDAAKARIIVKACESWEKIEPSLRRLMTKMRDAWTVEQDYHPEEKYFG